jgi:hypothetical protein
VIDLLIPLDVLLTWKCPFHIFQWTVQAFQNNSYYWGSTGYVSWLIELFTNIRCFPSPWMCRLAVPCACKVRHGCVMCFSQWNARSDKWHTSEKTFQTSAHVVMSLSLPWQSARSPSICALRRQGSEPWHSTGDHPSPPGQGLGVKVSKPVTEDSKFSPLALWLSRQELRDIP